MSDATLRTALSPEPQPLLPWLVVSVLGHVFAVGGFWGATALLSLLSAVLPMCAAPPPPITDAIEVSVVSLPKSAGNVPDRASRVARAEGVQAPNPDEPPPIARSDLKYQTPEVDPKTGNTDRSRQQMLDALEREQMLQDLMDAPEGPEDRNATDPNGTADAAIAALGVGSRGDPEFQRWVAQVQQLLMQHFKPLGAVTEGRPDLRCMVKLTVDPEDGSVDGYEVSESSGIVPFDQAAERAVQEIPALPLPPEKYRPLLAGGVAFRFTPP
jgi:TonB family protein